MNEIFETIQNVVGLEVVVRKSRSGQIYVNVYRVRFNSIKQKKTC